MGDDAPKDERPAGGAPPAAPDPGAAKERRALAGVAMGSVLAIGGLAGTLAGFAFSMQGVRFLPAYLLLVAGAALWIVSDRTLAPRMPTTTFDERLRRALPETMRVWLADPDFSIFFVVFMLVAAALYMRNPGGVGGQFVFDEQEAILANPYVRGQQPWRAAFDRDFWGLLPDRSIGSYRPVPNLLWRGLWRLQEWRNKGGSPSNLPFVWFNIVFHATNASILAAMVRATVRKVSTAWLAGGFFCAAAILTEAVSGIVGIADVLGGLSLLLALAALFLHPALAFFGVMAATVMGLFSKESAIVNVGLVPLAALCLGPQIDEKNPRRIQRAAAAFAGSVVAMLIYFKIRQHTFDKMFLEAHLHDGWRKVWSEQLKISTNKFPADPFNNPLAGAKPEQWSLRWAGALRVYFRGLVQVVVPNHLSPDYSTPQEPLPTKVLFPESILGALFLLVPPLAGLWLVFRGQRTADPVKEPQADERAAPGPDVAPRLGAERSLLGYALMAWPAAFFPLSNIPKPLPTVRAERFWYTPVLATSVVLALLLLWLARRQRVVAIVTACGLLSFQLLQARKHAWDFRDDLAFWESAARAVPNSAKAHLNYSVMLGARGVELRKWTYQQAQEARLVENKEAARLWPTWDMAVVYVGDTLCQLNRMDEAWEWYVKGFRLAPANTGLIALGLQCMSDHNALLGKEKEVLALADEPEIRASWLAYLLRDTLDRERKCRGVGLEPTEFPDVPEVPEVPDESPTAGSASGSASSSASNKTSGSASMAKAMMSSAAPKPAMSSAPPKLPLSAILSASAQGGAGSASASGSTSGTAAGTAAPAPKPAVAPLPPCGVDPKYRPRGLDGGPKGE